MHSNFLGLQYYWHMGALAAMFVGTIIFNTSSCICYFVWKCNIFQKHPSVVSNIVTQFWCAWMQPLRHFWIASTHDNNLFVHFYVVIVYNACIFEINALFSLCYASFLQPITIALPPPLVSVFNNSPLHVFHMYYCLSTYILDLWP